MPISVTCDECFNTVRVKDNALGKRFRCKGCGKPLVVQEDSPDDEWDDDEEPVQPRKPARRKKRSKSSSQSPAASLAIAVAQSKLFWFAIIWTGWLLYATRSSGLTVASSVVQCLIGLPIGLIGALGSTIKIAKANPAYFFLAAIGAPKRTVRRLADGGVIKDLEYEKDMGVAGKMFVWGMALFLLGITQAAIGLNMIDFDQEMAR